MTTFKIEKFIAEHKGTPKSRRATRAGSSTDPVVLARKKLYDQVVPYRVPVAEAQKELMVLRAHRLGIKPPLR